MENIVIFCSHTQMRLSMDIEHRTRKSNGTTAIEQSSHVNVANLCDFGLMRAEQKIVASNRTAIVIAVSRFFDTVAVSMGIVYGSVVLGKKYRDKLAMTKCKGQSDKQKKKKS